MGLSGNLEFFGNIFLKAKGKKLNKTFEQFSAQV